MKYETAARIISTMQAIQSHIDDSLRFVQAQESEDELRGYWKNMTKLLSIILLDVMVPIFKQYPDLTPKELRSDIDNPSRLKD